MSPLSISDPAPATVSPLVPSASVGLMVPLPVPGALTVLSASSSAAAARTGRSDASPPFTSTVPPSREASVDNAALCSASRKAARAAATGEGADETLAQGLLVGLSTRSTALWLAESDVAVAAMTATVLGDRIASLLMEGAMLLDGTTTLAASAAAWWATGWVVATAPLASAADEEVREMMGEVGGTFCVPPSRCCCCCCSSCCCFLH